MMLPVAAGQVAHDHAAGAVGTVDTGTMAYDQAATMAARGWERSAKGMIVSD